MGVTDPFGLSNMVIVFVTVLDANDNAPIFTNASYRYFFFANIAAKKKFHCVVIVLMHLNFIQVKL